jgi:hypothetical protein
MFHVVVIQDNLYPKVYDFHSYDAAFSYFTHMVKRDYYVCLLDKDNKILNATP